MHIGDLAGNPVHSQDALILAVTMTVVSYVIILGPIFSFFYRVGVKRVVRIDCDLEIANRIGVVLLLIQISFLVFNLSTGVNVAGSNNNRDGGPLGLLFVFLPADMLFMIYYGAYRNSKYFAANFCIWLVSNLLRGWAGVVLLAIFMEWCRLARKRELRLRYISFAVVVIVGLYPILQNFKWVMRASAAGLGIEEFVNIFTSNFDSIGYGELIYSGVEHIIGRLQIVGTLVEVMRISDQLQAAFDQGMFAPFWMEGLHGIFWERLTTGERPVWISVAFTEYAGFSQIFEVGDWNVNIGYIGWFFVAPIFIPLYVLYTLVLGFSIVQLHKKISSRLEMRDLAWYFWLFYLMAPWLSSVVAYVYALIVFWAMVFLANNLRVVRR